MIYPVFLWSFIILVRACVFLEIWVGATALVFPAWLAYTPPHITIDAAAALRSVLRFVLSFGVFFKIVPLSCRIHNLSISAGFICLSKGWVCVSFLGRLCTLVYRVPSLFWGLRGGGIIGG